MISFPSALKSNPNHKNPSLPPSHVLILWDARDGTTPGAREGRQRHRAQKRKGRVFYVAHTHHSASSFHRPSAHPPIHSSNPICRFASLSVTLYKTSRQHSVRTLHDHLSYVQIMLVTYCMPASFSWLVCFIFRSLEIAETTTALPGVTSSKVHHQIAPIFLNQTR